MQLQLQLQLHYHDNYKYICKQTTPQYYTTQITVHSTLH